MPTSFSRIDLVRALSQIKTMGFVKTHRAHDTGIGKTLEDLLEIKENNIRLPDLGDYELKAKRIESASMLTLATKSPLPRGINKILFEKYKYMDKEQHYNLHSTVRGSKTNPQGFKISIIDDKLTLENRQNINAYWPLSTFHDVLQSKSGNLILVLAEAKGDRKSIHEHFHYKEAFLLSGLNPSRFKKAIDEDWLKVDIRIGCYRSGSRKGLYHDHGTAFRIGKFDYMQLYEKIEQIL